MNSKIIVIVFCDKIKTMIKNLFFIFFIFSLFFTSQTIYTQIGSSEEDIVFDITPEYPTPNTDTYISIESYVFDLNSSNINWKINGKSVLTGVGKKRLVFMSGNLNSETEIEVEVKTINGQLLIKNFIIKPTSLDILWEADTYTPPFFKGKPMFTRQASVYLYAMPNIFQGQNKIPKEKLVYKWSNNGKLMNNVSGYGKYYIQINSTILGRDMEIEVEATDPQTGQVAYNSVILSPTEPIIYLYEKDPLFGIKQEKALENIQITDSNEKEIIAIPYFFSTRKINGLTYDWSINGRQIEDGQNIASRVFRKIKDVFGKAKIDVSVTNDFKIMQSSQSSIIIDFPKPKEENNNVIQ